MFQQLSDSPTPACNDNGSFFRHGREDGDAIRQHVEGRERDVRPDLLELCGAGRVHHLQPGAYLGSR